MEEPKPRRRLLRLRRPRLPRGTPKPPEAPKPFEPSKSFEAPKPSRPPKPPSDLWFRFTTRLRAIYYGGRELAQRAWRWLRKSRDDWVDWWTERSGATRIRILAVAGVAALYAVVKFAPVPGVPCQISAAKECAPPDETIAFVPANAVLYAHLSLDSDSHQHELTSDLAEELPDVINLLRQATSALPTPSGKPVDVSTSILPWADQDLALVQVPGPGKSSPPAFIVGVGDRGAADQFLAGIAPQGKAQSAEQNGSPLSLYPGGFATAYSGDQLIFGSEAAVRAGLDAEAGRAPGLEGSDQDAARDELPDVRFAEVYLSRAGVERTLVGRQGGATQLETFVDYGATSGLAASATAQDDGVEINLVSRLDPALLERSPTFFANLPEFEPGLAGEAGERALGYIGVGEVGATLATLLESAGAQGEGLAGSLRALAQSLQQEAGVDPLRDLLPALGGQAALVAEPTDGIPYASLIVDDIDEEKASAALARLQKPLVEALGTQTGTAAPSFEQSEEDGVTVSSLRVSPTVNLSYAVFDGKLVVSTDPAGVAQVHSGEGGLAGSSSYEAALDQLPDQVSVLVFLNLDELLGLAEQAGLAEDPLYASLSDDISQIRSLGLAVNGDDDQLKSELFLATD
ncbi:MAG: DUF3352 domain-containing protein [Solirubrobacterales bacterium]